VVLDALGRVLLVQRARPPSVGSWTLPGGRIHQGEAPRAAVVRELREETGLRTRVVCSLGAVMLAREGFSYRIHEYLAVARDDAPLRPGDDAADARWVHPTELASLGISEQVVELVDRAIDRLSRTR